MKLSDLNVSLLTINHSLDPYDNRKLLRKFLSIFEEQNKVWCVFDKGGIKGGLSSK